MVNHSFHIFVDKSYRRRHRGGFPPFRSDLCGSDVTVSRHAFGAGTFPDCRCGRSMIHF
jgi:hypothetical protein